MREIKFRAWLKYEKLMVPVISWHEPHGKVGVSIQDSGPFLISSDKFDLMQFTGLKDKNGREIYEDDIAKYTDGRVGHISFCDGSFEMSASDGYMFRLSAITPSDCLVVIGNIHENPELIADGASVVEVSANG